MVFSVFLRKLSLQETPMKPLDNLALKQIERRLKLLKKQSENMRVRTGWIRYIRTALGMNLETLAKRSRLSVSTLSQNEKREGQGKVTLETLKKMAAAMDCELVYAIIPRTDLGSAIKEQAQSKATRILRKADTHMTLEDQTVQSSMKERIETLSEKLIKDGDIW